MRPAKNGVAVDVLAGTTTPVLNHSHRCDRCSGRAYVLAILNRSRRLPFGGVLLFCNHHWARHNKALSHLMAQVIDERDQLTKHVTDDRGVR